jgi:Protein of unknown function (DUF4019)
MAADKPEDAAQSAAESWLKLVDDGNYAASWEQAARVFKGAVKPADWSQMAGGVRTPLGRLVSRKPSRRSFPWPIPTVRGGCPALSFAELANPPSRVPADLLRQGHDQGSLGGTAARWRAAVEVSDERPEFAQQRRFG